MNAPYKTKVKPPSELTPQLVKRAHHFYEELERQEVRAVEEMEEAERKTAEAETKK